MSETLGSFAVLGDVIAAGSSVCLKPSQDTGCTRGPLVPVWYQASYTHNRQSRYNSTVVQGRAGGLRGRRTAWAVFTVYIEDKAKSLWG